MSTDLSADATFAGELVREAGLLAAQMRHDGLETETKTSVSDVVTAADRAAEDLVVRRLTRLRPDDAIVGEEGAGRSGTSGRTWVIDPVDGTYNFVQGLPWWCSAVALEVDDEPLLGAVFDPGEDAVYVGGVGVPATRDGVALAPIEDRSLARSAMATYLHPPSYATEVGRAFDRMVSGAATVRMLGSGTLEAVAVAEGRLHVVCHHSVPSWDRLPGEAIIRAAGGVSRRVEAAGVEWYVAGAPTAVAEVVAALQSR